MSVPELLRMVKKGVSKAEWVIKDIWESSQDTEGNLEGKKKIRSYNDGTVSLVLVEC